MLLTASQQWVKTLEFYDELSSWHRQEPMKVLVNAVAEAGAENAVWPTHSHFVLGAFPEQLTGSDVNTVASVSAEYRHEINKFRLRFFYIHGVPYDEKWCGLDEAEATLRLTFRLLREYRVAASIDKRG